MDQPLIVMQAGCRFQSVILDGNSLRCRYLFGLEITQTPFIFILWHFDLSLTFWNENLH